jgi:hypothetical protein
MQVGFMAVPAGFEARAGFMAVPVGSEAGPGFMAVPAGFMVPQAPIPAPLVALVMEASPGAIPWVGGRASVEASTAVEDSMAVGGMVEATDKLGFVLIKTNEMEREIMRTRNAMLEKSSGRWPASLVTLAGIAVMVLGYAQSSFAQKLGPKTFSSAGEACHALHQAVQNDDEQALETILGGGKEITSEGDESADKLERQQFSQKYQEMHRLVKEPDGTTVLYIGAENWPFPIPLMSKNGRWYFDSQTGTQEILFRRVGENEATAVEVGRALLTAEQQPERTTSDDPIRQYAQKLVSTDNTNRANLEKQPFGGYYFELPIGKPGNTPSGTYSRVSNRKKRGGLALVAYPAQYRSSGVMTFIVTQDGAVYEKDLGKNTARLASQIKQPPASGWNLVK